MTSRRILVPLAALAFAACGGGDDKAAAAASDTLTPPPPVTTEAPPAPAGTADTAGMGTNPPTAGGPVVDSAAVPGPADTLQGTPTAP